MDDFIYKYFLEPITSHSGYNVVNTLVYALIALIMVYVIFKILNKTKIKIDKEFIVGTLSFVLLGSTVRVVTDSIDTGVFQEASLLHKIVLDSHLYDYGFVTASPGIYLVIASLFFISLTTVIKLNKIEWLKFIGIGLWIPNIFLILPFMKYAVYLIPIILLAIIPAVVAVRYLKDWRAGFMVGAQGLDGAATFFMIDFFGKITGIGYGEQHVFSRAIGELFGTYFTFYLVKILLAAVASYFIFKEKMDEQERNYIILLIIIIGLAPGIRDVLRMTIGG